MRAIDADVLFREMEKAQWYNNADRDEIAEELVLNAPTIEPQPQRTGRWILVKGSNGKDYHKCSECLHTQEITGVKNYCAVCGAEMEGQDARIHNAV